MSRTFRIVALGSAATIGAVTAVLFTVFSGSSALETKDVQASSKHSAAAPKEATVSGPKVPAYQEMSVFSRAATPSDQIPDDLARSTEAALSGQSGGVDPSLVPGALTQRSRLVMDGVGSMMATVYAAVTDKGEVCQVSSNGLPSGCFSSFDDFTGHITWSVATSANGSDPPVVLGLIPDSVRSISVIVTGATFEATLGENSFAYQLSQGDQWPDALVITYTDGTTFRLDLPKLPQSVTTP
jgi:hypothetical protein